MSVQPTETPIIAVKFLNMKILLEKFYTAFKQCDGDAMAACYHDEVVFEDPAFGVLKGEHAKNMWRMLCASQRDRDFKLTFKNIVTDGDAGSAHWEAHYEFSKTKRQVHNIVEAKFKFKDGKIIDHRDHFNLYRWSKQALGTSGMLIGWTPFFKSKLHEQTGATLAKYEAKN